MTRKITPAQLDDIEAAAKEAHAQPWGYSWESRLDDADFHTVVHDSECVVHIADVTQGGADAEHIAMMDPATTLALIAEVRELRAKVERVEAIHRPIRAVLYPGTSERVMEVCAECRTSFGDWHPWPCPTIRALDAS